MLGTFTNARGCAITITTKRWIEGAECATVDDMTAHDASEFVELEEDGETIALRITDGRTQILLKKHPKGFELLSMTPPPNQNLVPVFGVYAKGGK
jgi:hypothetical protein